MKNLRTPLLSLLFLSLLTTVSCGQKPSPPATAKGSVDGIDITIDYHQPSARGRVMLGKKEPYGEVWRTGANDATTIEFSSDVKVEGNALSKGKYALFTIPGEEEWIIIFNNKAKQWGAYDYNQEADALRVTVKAGKTASFVETFEIDVVSDGVTLEWENTAVKFGISK